MVVFADVYTKIIHFLPHPSAGSFPPRRQAPQPCGRFEAIRSRTQHPTHSRLARRQEAPLFHSRAYRSRRIRCHSSNRFSIPYFGILFKVFQAGWPYLTLIILYKENTLTVNVNRLRKKLESAGLSDFITTKIGSGYIIE